MFNQGIYSKSSGGGGTGQGITAVVANYSALPLASAAPDEFYFVESPQGTAWLPGSLGGTYYPAGLYYSNGVTWFYAESPYQASQATVNAGINTDQFVSPYTLANATTVERPLTFSTGLTRSVNTITANISTGISGGQTIYGGTGASEILTISSTTNATKGTIQIGSTDLVNVGNAVTTNQRIFRAGQDTSYVDLGSLVGTGTVAAIYMNKATPSASNYTLHVTAGDTVALNGAFLTFKTSNVNRLTVDASTFIFTPGNASALGLTGFSWTSGANINQTASAEIPGVNWNLRTRQWATGAITTQREFLLQAPTYSFVAASTITSAATFAVSAAPTAGTNATITNSYSIWSQSGGVRFDDGTGYLRILAVPTITTTVGLFFNQATPSASNWALRADTSNVTLNAPTSSILLAIAGGTRATINSTNFSFQPAAASAGASTTFEFTSSSDNNQTAGTEKKTFNLASATIAHATGAITTQRFAVINIPTYSFAAASTITNSATFAIAGAPVAGTNATITNSYSLWVQGGTSRFDGSVSLKDASDIIIGTTTGTKIGTATTQKIGFWNATPIVQPTTAIAASTFAANTSGIVDDTATFDGYTIGQITKALRNLGILA